MISSPNVSFSSLTPAGDDIFATLCARRGWDDEFFTALDEPVTDVLQNMPVAVELLEKWRQTGTEITIYPDFDMDGVSAGVIAYAGLCELGFNVNLYIPNHQWGHDFTSFAVKGIMESYPSTQVIITCDTGINAVGGIRAAHEAGVFVMVTDHHLEESECPADIAINPNRLPETYSFKDICGAAVMYFVVEEYTRRYQPAKSGVMWYLRLFAGLGTLADVMPVVRVNRELIRDSLSIAKMLYSAPGYTDKGVVDASAPGVVEDSPLARILSVGQYHPVFVSAFLGFGGLLRQLSVSGGAGLVSGVNEQLYGFSIAPAFNSTRRIDGDMIDCFSAFVAVDPDVRERGLLQVLDNNERRKSVLKEYMGVISSQEHPFPGVIVTDALPGLLGLIATKVCRETGRPVAVVNPPREGFPYFSGSMRAPGWFNILDCLSPRFEVHGHQHACGVRFGEDEIREFSSFLSSVADDVLSTAVVDEAPFDVLISDRLGADLSPFATEDIMFFIGEVEKLRPFGHGFEAPVVAVDVDLASSTVRKLGRDGRHVKITTGYGFECLWWNSSERWYEELVARKQSGDPVVRFTVDLGVNLYNGVVSPQAIVRDLIG